MRLKGSYTVEAALLMALIIPLFAGIIYLGFYLHNGAAMQNAAYELAALGSLHYGEKDGEEIVKERKREIVSQAFLGIQGIEAEIHIGKKKIAADFQGSLQVPGLVMRFFCGNRLQVRGHAALSAPQPQKTVMRIHLLKKIKEEVKNGSNVSP
ncbi:TadE family protein [Lachnospiraceae bacterium 46-15]